MIFLTTQSLLAGYAMHLWVSPMGWNQKMKVFRGDWLQRRMDAAMKINIELIDLQRFSSFRIAGEEVDAQAHTVLGYERTEF